MATSQGQGVQTEVRKEGLSEAKRRLLEQRMRGMAPRKENDYIRSRPAGTPVPLSAEQRSVWLHASQQLDLPIYNEPFTIHRYGSFDLGILEASMNEILRRHEAWRTSFSPEGEVIIHPRVRVTLPLVDLSGLPRAKREAEALRIATDDAQKPIPLHAVPLFRARVVRMKADEHRLYLTLHHIIFDGVSIPRIFVPELSAIYASFEQGNPTPFSPPVLQYGDYAIWRERHVDSPVAKQHLAYWLEQLSGELPVLRLPEDRPRPAILSHRGSMECFEVPDELVESLHRLSRAQGVTLYMTLLAAFQVLLFRYSGQNDLIVGSATDARRRPELEGVMGFFLDTFAIRTRPIAELRFSEYLAQTRDSVLGGLAAGDVPFDRVVQAVNPKRDSSHHPIFQAFFSVRPAMPPFSEGWNLTQMDVTVGASKFVLHLELSERPDRMEARFLYSTEIWDAPTIRRMATHWIVLLQSVCQNPEGTLGTLAILSPEETAALLGLGGWNDTARAFPQTTLNALIEDQVRRTPHAIAAAFGNERWSYEELNSRADGFASLLGAVGVTRGSIVAIVLDRSLDLLAALIAVLKTGAAYLPVDIRMPRERIALYLADAEPSAILTQCSMVEQVGSSASAIVLVDGNRENQDLAAIDALANKPTQSTNNLDDTAYLIYTSGTTAEPKAVEISQRSLVNLLAAMLRTPGFGPEDVFLAVTPISFDIAALELFLPVICGGTVVIASREEAQDPYLLARAISRSGCTVMQATPAAWRTLLLAGWDDARQRSTGNSSRMLRVLCGGEALPRELANRLLATGAELWNMYGPTETTIWSLINRVRLGTEKETDPVSVGRPIANTKAYILDEQRQPLPVGVPGELFLGGVGLAKGYRGQPQQTADRFTTVDSVGGVRLYRTGDIAVRRVDGTVEVLGRTDNQVKVRGYRVELEAVEAAVLRHPHVAAAAARAWPESTGELRLSVYVVASGAHAPNLADMRAFLGNSLPDSMIPSDVIPLPAIPLTPHGKVDRARLPAPTGSETLPLQTTLCSSEESRLAAIWSDLLGWKEVGLDDNFFDLGGHSLLVAALQQRIAKEFGQRVPVTELFHSPTVRQQAELTQRLVKGDTLMPPGVLALNPHGTRNPIFWVHSLNGKLLKAMGDDQPSVIVSLTAEDVASLGKAPSLQSIAGCHLRKILATQSQGPYTIGGQCAGGILSYEVASQLQTAGHEVSLLVLLDAPNPAYMGARHPLTPKLSHLSYFLKRAERLGLRLSLIYFRERLVKRFARTVRGKSARTEMRINQEMMEAAARAYQPEKYQGKVLLLLATDRPPHENFLPGWQAVVPGNLHVRYVDGHHRELVKPQNLRSVVDAIVSHLTPTTDEKCLSCGADTPRSTSSGTKGGFDQDMGLDTG
jgi:amino acid adenylation domain-containing protein